MQFKVKFFGTKERKGQLVQVKTVVSAESRETLESALRRAGYVKINGLKVSAIE